MKRGVAVLLFLVVLICTSSMAQADIELENLLLNPKFEEGEDGNAYNWTHETTDTERINEQSLIGDWSMWMGDITTGYSGRETTSHSFEVSSGKEFKFGIYYYLDGVNGQDPEDYTLFGRIQWLDENKDWLGTSQSPSSGFSPKEFDEWEKDKHTITAHEDAEYGRLRITAKRDDADYEKTDVYWDNASIRMVGSKESYDITFKVLCMEDEYLEGAGVYVEGIGERETGERGEVTFEDMDPDVYNYEISKDGYEAIDGEVEIADGDVEEEVILEEKYEDEEEVERVEINSASQGELEKIKHIRESRAEWIKENCDSFYSLAQLVYVKGLGEKTTKEIIKEGKAYVLPPGENWDLSEDPCSEEDEEEGDDEDCEEVVREVTVVEEETIYKEREFELIGHDETVEQGSGISADLLIRNDENQAKNYTIYSYVYDNNRVFTTGNWTSNRKTVEMEGNEKRVVGLENTVEEDAPLGLHDFRVRVRDEKDLDSEVNITESEDIEDKKVVENKTEVNMTEENVTEENVTPEKETVPETPAGRTFESPTPLEEVWLGFLDLLGL